MTISKATIVGFFGAVLAGAIIGVAAGPIPGWATWAVGFVVISSCQITEHVVRKQFRQESGVSYGNVHIQGPSVSASRRQRP